MTDKSPFDANLDIELLRSIVEMLPTAIFVKDDHLRFVLSNAAHSNLIGIAEKDIVGLTDYDTFRPEDCVAYEAMDREVLNTGNIMTREETAMGKDGRLNTGLTRKVKFVASNGRTYLIGTSTDMQAVKDREIALAAKEAHYRALAESVPVGIWHLRFSGETLYINPHLTDLFGLDNAEDFTDKVFDCLPALAGQTLDMLFGEKTTFETDVRRDGKVAARVMVVSSGWTEDGDGLSAFVNFVDITKLNNLLQLNDEVTRLNKALSEKISHLNEAHEQIVRAGKMAQIGQLTATVAHELRNPLGAVRTSAFLLERKLKGKDMGVEAQLERINNGITRCDKIITQLLDFARTRGLQAQSLDFDGWLEKLVAEEAAKLPTQVNINCVLGLSNLIATFDPEQFSRCIINMMSNASEAMVGKAGELAVFNGDAPQITVETQLTNRGVEISFTDNGPGMAPEILARIREPLFTTKSFGTGLGVPAVENILLQHQGGMDMASTLGTGSTFLLWFPLTGQRTEAAA
jgi:PAS domain S-box-containing protein